MTELHERRESPAVGERGIRPPPAYAVEAGPSTSVRDWLAAPRAHRARAQERAV